MLSFSEQSGPKQTLQMQTIEIKAVCCHSEFHNRSKKTEGKKNNLVQVFDRSVCTGTVTFWPCI